MTDAQAAKMMEQGMEKMRKAIEADRLRDCVRQFTSRAEFELLYPEEPPDTAGSASKHAATHPSRLLYSKWALTSAESITQND